VCIISTSIRSCQEGARRRNDAFADGTQGELFWQRESGEYSAGRRTDV
jgi:hypothetical protein